MRTFILILSLTVFVISCKNEKGKNNVDHKTAEKKQQKQTINIASKPVKEGVNLCKINGKDWQYTKASGIVSRHKKTGKRTAIITFKKKLDKGSESIQLKYDGDSFDLESASLQLKFSKKDGGLMTGFYDLFPDTRDRNHESDMSGTLDLSNTTTASGNAELINFNISYEKELLENPKDAIVTVSDLHFLGIPYSDIDKLFKQ